MQSVCVLTGIAARVWSGDRARRACSTRVRCRMLDVGSGHQRERVVMITFDSEQHAEALASNVRSNAVHQAAVGIELVAIRVVEVSASV